MLLSAYLRGLSGLLDVGFRFYDETETPTSARSEVGVLDCGDGYYSVIATPPEGSAWIRWDSTGTPLAKAREALQPALDLEFIRGTLAGVGSPDAPVLVIPAPALPEFGAVGALCILPSGEVAAGVSVTFTLHSPSGGPVRAGSLVAERTVEAVTDPDGLLAAVLMRNDTALPAGTYWTITNESLGLKKYRFTLDVESLNLGTLILPA